MSDRKQISEWLVVIDCNSEMDLLEFGRIFCRNLKYGITMFVSFTNCHIKSCSFDLNTVDWLDSNDWFVATGMRLKVFAGRFCSYFNRFSVTYDTFCSINERKSNKLKSFFSFLFAIPFDFGLFDFYSSFQMRSPYNWIDNLLHLKKIWKKGRFFFHVEL